MKHRNSEIITERNADFIRAYRAAISENDCASIKDYVKIAIKMPSRRFWIEKDRAYDIITMMENCVLFASPNPNKIRMYDEIYIRYKKRMDENPCRQKYDIIEDVINEEAPEFYIGIHSAMKIVNRNNRRVRRLRHEKK